MRKDITEKLLDPDIYYHVVFPTYERLPLFKDVAAKATLIELIEDTIVERDIDVMIYKLLSDHCHLLIHKQYHQNLPDLVKYLKGRSTYYFYKQHPDYKIDLGRGKLWAKDYHSVVITDVRQLENTVLYIHNNYDRYENTHISSSNPSA